MPNGIALKYPTNRIVALDFSCGVAAVELPSNETRLAQLDTRALTIKA